MENSSMCCADYEAILLEPCFLSRPPPLSSLSSFHLQYPRPCADSGWSCLPLSLHFSPSAAAAAPAPGPVAPVIPPPAQGDSTPWTLRRLAQYQRLLRLQLVGHRHKNGLNVVAVSPAVVSVSLAVRVLCRCLKHGHGVGVGELLRHVRAHLDGVLEVALVSNQDPGYLCAQRVLLALLDPGREAAEAGGVGNVVDEDNSVHVAVVVLHHGLPEALLTCSVPQLDLWGGTVWKWIKSQSNN